MPSTPWTQPSRLNHLVLKFPPSVYDSSVAFYTKTLATLGYVPIHNYGVAMGFGPKDGRADFWIGQGADENVGVNAGLHFAFDADGAFCLSLLRARMTPVGARSELMRG